MNGGQKSSDKGSEKSSDKILAEIVKNRDISAKELATILGLTPRAVEKQISQLKVSGRIKRVGGRKIGHWEIVVAIPPCPVVLFSVQYSRAYWSYNGIVVVKINVLNSGHLGLPIETRGTFDPATA